jgi:hypothetical protein
LKNAIQEVNDNLGKVVREVKTQYNKIGKPLFRNFVKPYVLEQLKGKTDKEINDHIDNLLTIATEDESMYGQSFTAMANSRNDILRLVDLPVKEAKDRARNETIDVAHKLEKAQQDLEAAGYNTKFLGERDRHGNLTGRYIQDRDWKRYRQEYKDYVEEIKERYHGASRAWIQKLKDQWIDEHTDPDGKPRLDMYVTDVYKNLSEAEKKFYRIYTSVKEQMDSYLPEERILKGFLPQKRKAAHERLEAKKFLKNLKETMKEEFTFVEDEDTLGEMLALEDFGGDKYNMLPVYYNNKIVKTDEFGNIDPKTAQNLSEEFTSNLMQYAYMAISYKELGKINNIMELGSNVIRGIQVQAQQGDQNLVEKIKALGQTASRFIFNRTDSNMYKKYKNFVSSKVYGKTVKKEQIGKVNVTKVGGVLMKLTALNTFALNFLGGSANVVQGVVQHRIESMRGKYFNNKNLHNATNQYRKMLKDFIKETTSRRRYTFGGLLLEKFNVLQNFEEVMRNTDMNRKGLKRLLNGSTVFFLNTMGEHFLQTRTFLAYADSLKLKQNGNDIKLINAFDIVTNEDGSSALKIKDGVRWADGREFTEEDISRISRISADINQKLNGVYNQDDAANAQQ